MVIMLRMLPIVFILLNALSLYRSLSIQLFDGAFEDFKKKRLTNVRSMSKQVKVVYLKSESELMDVSIFSYACYKGNLDFVRTFLGTYLFGKEDPYPDLQIFSTFAAMNGQVEILKCLRRYSYDFGILKGMSTRVDVFTRYSPALAAIAHNHDRLPGRSRRSIQYDNDWRFSEETKRMPGAERSNSDVASPNMAEHASTLITDSTQADKICNDSESVFVSVIHYLSICGRGAFNVKTASGLYPVCLAIVKNKIGLFDFLVEREANPNVLCRNFNLVREFYQGKSLTPLMFFVRELDFDRAIRLSSPTAFELKDNEEKNAFIHAIEAMQWEKKPETIARGMKFLSNAMQYRNAINLSLKVYNGYNALLLACMAGLKPVVELILQDDNTYTDINEVLFQNYTPLIGAAISKDYDTVDFLIQKGAVITNEDVHGRNCLDIAFEYFYFLCAVPRTGRIQIERIYNYLLPMFPKKKVTELQSLNDEFIIECEKMSRFEPYDPRNLVNLIRLGADVNHMTKKGLTCFALAMMAAKADVCDILLAYNASPDLIHYNAPTVRRATMNDLYCTLRKFDRENKATTVYYHAMKFMESRKNKL